MQCINIKSIISHILKFLDKLCPYKSDTEREIHIVVWVQELVKTALITLSTIYAFRLKYLFVFSLSLAEH